jgi:hypothetical protein
MKIVRFELAARFTGFHVLLSFATSTGAVLIGNWK